MKPGEAYDHKGIPIYPGDLLRTPHFQTSKRKYYLYHTAVCIDGVMWMVPTSHLEPTLVASGGKCMLSDAHAAEAEIISGFGPDEYIDYGDRPRRKNVPGA